MREIDNYKRIYKYPPFEDDCSITFSQSGPNVKIHTLNINSNNNHLFAFDEQFSKLSSNLFKKESQCTRNADGIVIYDDGMNKTMLLCEMKSSGGGVFNNAFQQTLSSYIKLCMMMSICDDFDISSYHIYFIFTAQDGPELAVRRNELEQIEDSQKKFEDEVRLKLLKGERVKFMINDVAHDISFLHRYLINREVECMLLTSSTDTVNFDVGSL